MAKAQLLKNILSDTAISDARNDGDTLRLWENYRDQALMWRALMLLQIPVTAIALLCTIIMWATRETVLQVPSRPLPGIYVAQDIPDTEFIEVTTNFLNLIATYQPTVAKRQFLEARQMLLEPMLARFNTEMMDTELKAIEATSRTQIFFADPGLTTLERLSPREVTISMIGDRLKLVAGKELPMQKSRYTVTLTTVPRQTLNPYGIMITNTTMENIDRRDLR